MNDEYCQCKLIDEIARLSANMLSVSNEATFNLH